MKKSKTASGNKTNIALNSVPLPLDGISILHENVDWNAIEWGPDSVTIAQHNYPLKTIHFKPRTKK